MNLTKYFHDFKSKRILIVGDAISQSGETDTGNVDSDLTVKKLDWI